MRLTQEQLRDRGVRSRLEAMHVTAIVDGQTATDAPNALRELADRGVDVGNGGWGHGRPFRFLRAQTDVARTSDVMQREAGVKCREFVPERRLDFFDQLWSRRRHQRLVEPDFVFKPETLPSTLAERKIIVLDGRERDTASVRVALADLHVAIRDASLSSAPLSGLR